MLNSSLRTTWSRINSSPWRTALAISLPICLLAVIAGVQFFGGPIRGTDAWPLYEQTKLDGFGDLIRLSTEQVRDVGPDAALPYWRPVALWSYSA